MALKGVTSREQGLLEAAGLWGGFVEHRKDLVQVAGLSPSAASKRALAVFMSDGKPASPNALDLVNNVTAAGGNGTPAQTSSTTKEATHDSLKVAPSALAGRTATETEVARWVARNIDNPAADPAGCPDPFAWTLLRMCREDAAFALMFVKDIWTKLLASQARQGEEDTGGKIDGTPTLELIQRIRIIRDNAHRGVAQQEARGVHYPEVAGSNPVPANSESFDEFKGGE